MAHQAHRAGTVGGRLSSRRSRVSTGRTVAGLEFLESRLLLSHSAIVDVRAGFYHHATTPTFSPGFVIGKSAANGPTGFAPADVRTAYGIDQTFFGNVAGDGTGQTIAIVDAYADPTVLTDLQAFDAQFGLPDPQLTVINQNGGTTLPSQDPNGRGNSWAVETSLDVQWSHAVAPGRILCWSRRIRRPGSISMRRSQRRSRIPAYPWFP